MFARTERLLLRPGWQEDAPALARAIGEEAVVRNLARAPWPYGEEEAQQFLSQPIDPTQPRFLIFARTETEMFHRWVWERADAVLFLRGRLHFHYVDGQRAAANAGAPSCLIAYGHSNVEALAASGIAGHIVRLSRPTG